jgi:hypothetical protein
MTQYLHRHSLITGHTWRVSHSGVTRTGVIVISKRKHLLYSIIRLRNKEGEKINCFGKSCFRFRYLEMKSFYS